MANELNLNDLNLVEEQVGDVDFDNLPEGGGFPKPPQPGTYRFTLPSEFSGKMFQTVQDPEGGARVKVVFEDDKQLKMEGNKSFRTQLSNVARARGKEGTKVSDLALLLKKGLGEESAPTSNVGYAQALARHAGESFIADIEWSAKCNPARDIYKEGKKQEGTKGCGTEFRMEAYTKKDGKVVYAIPQQNGQWLDEFECPNPACKAIVRAFANVSRFKSAK